MRAPGPRLCGALPPYPCLSLSECHACKTCEPTVRMYNSRSTERVCTHQVFFVEPTTIYAPLLATLQFWLSSHYYRNPRRQQYLWLHDIRLLAKRTIRRPQSVLVCATHKCWSTKQTLMLRENLSAKYAVLTLLIVALTHREETRLVAANETLGVGHCAWSWVASA